MRDDSDDYILLNLYTDITPDKVMRSYIDRIPSEKLPRGFYLVHNHVKPARNLGARGFRAWVQDDAKGLVQCKCSFGRIKNAKVNKHYRVEATMP